MKPALAIQKPNPPLDLRWFVRTALVRVVCRHGAALLASGLACLAAPAAMASPFPAEFELSDLLVAGGGDGSIGTAFNGAAIVDNVGHSISLAGDVNDDGFGDLIMSTGFGSPGGRNNAGQTYVVFGTGQGWPAEFELSSLLSVNGGDGSAGFVLNGVDASDRSGTSVSAAGDVNGDGIDDLVIGAPDADPANPTRGGTPPTRPDAGETYVVFGTDQGFAAEFELSTLLPVNGGDGTKGFVINGILSNDRSGRAVANAGDINDDGLDDLVIGSTSNEAYVVFGNNLGFGAEFDLSTLLAANGGDGSAGFLFDGTSFAQTGSTVSAVGDMNGDGIDDLLIGSSGASPGARFEAGQCVVLFGHDQGFPAEMTQSALLPENGGDGSAGILLNGINAGDSVCRSGAASAGDVNGDGLADIVVGAERAGFPGLHNAGQSYIVFGNPAFPVETELSSLLSVNGGDGSMGVVLNGIGEDDESGSAVSGAGDINGDGMADVLIGAPFAWPGGREYAGEGYVIYGKPSGFPAEIELSSLHTANGGDGSLGFVLNGVNEDDEAGTSVSAAGDFNNDGIDDVLIAAESAGPGGRVRAGQVYVVLGRPDTDADGDGVGDTNDNCKLVANAGQCDTNGDGYGNHCDADLDNNGIVNSFDLSLMRNSFGASGVNDADLDCDGIVNSFDLSTMRASFGLPPGPSALVP